MSRRGSRRGRQNGRQPRLTPRQDFLLTWGVRIVVYAGVILAVYGVYWLVSRF